MRLVIWDLPVGVTRSIALHSVGRGKHCGLAPELSPQGNIMSTTPLDTFYSAAIEHIGQRRFHTLTPLFAESYEYDKHQTVLHMFLLRDKYNGFGQREMFRVLLNWTATHDPGTFLSVASNIPNIGRWDDLLIFAGHHRVTRRVQEIVQGQLARDIGSLGRPSYLAKWLPSENASSPTTRNNARWWAYTLRTYTHMMHSGSDLRAYRLTLSTLRRRLRIIERPLSLDRLRDIDYNSLGRNAAYKYRRTLRERDGERYARYLESIAQRRHMEYKIQEPETLFRSAPYATIAAELTLRGLVERM
jgi:hypothetical protein